LAILREAADEYAAFGTDPTPAGFNQHMAEQVPMGDNPPAPADVADRVDGDQLERVERKDVHVFGLGRHAGLSDDLSESV
jgi:hypothetical protein